MHGKPLIIPYIYNCLFILKHPHTPLRVSKINVEHITIFPSKYIS